MNPIDKKIVDVIKSLGIDMIDKARSGHPGIVLSAAPIIYTLYSRHLKFNPKDDKWLDRDRFVMSAGHGSALLYATLYMAGFDLSLDDLKEFRQINSKTPGHPEINVTPGVDMSTGPLGQGFASSVGMAIAEKYLKEKYNKKINNIQYNIFDHNVYVLCGDGDLMEGITTEAASLAGTLKLDNLIVLYDSNDTSLDGKTNITFTENILDKFNALNWNTILVKNGSNIDDIDKAITQAKKSDKPTLIEIKTILGKGSLLEGSNKTHGAPLSKEDIEQLKEKMGLRNIPFTPSNDAVEQFRNMIGNRVNNTYDKWNDMYKEYIDLVDNDIRRDFNILNGGISKLDLSNLPKKFDNDLDEALRVTNGKILNLIAQDSNLLIGGSADLSSSTKTYITDGGDFSKTNYKGKNIWFGVREHAMGAILNGISLYNIRTFGSTFLSFSDYLKPAIRMSALMNLPVVYIFTHDSINIGEDGPTHQPIEQLTMLRSIPNLTVYRPCDAKELIGSIININQNNSPACLILSRNNVKIQENSNAKKVELGAYTIKKEKGKLNGIIIATGSEVETATKISQELSDENLGIRVVSVPSLLLFQNQPEEYKNEILPIGVKKIVLEASNTIGLEQFVYGEKNLINLKTFGVSGKKEDVLKYMNFDYETVKNRVRDLIK